MRSLFRIMVILLLVTMVGYYFTHIENKSNQVLIQEDISPAVDYSIERANQVKNYNIEERPSEGVSVLIGKNKEEIKKLLGKPVRIDPSAYGYDWWIYNNKLDEYIQIGMAEDTVVTLYSNSKNLEVTPFKIGQTVDEVYSSVLIEREVFLQIDDNAYRFELSEEDMNIRPLIPIGDIFVQLYIDKFTGTLSSVRFIDGPTLVKQRPYELNYRGKLFGNNRPTKEERQNIEASQQDQILDITNSLRLRFDLPPLLWDENVADVAYAHSKDMFIGKYFSHESPRFGNLADRLEVAGIDYEFAGENIAVQYVDGPSAVEGWFNSKEHRETMLRDGFTHVGIGVYEKHYTQNFLKERVEEEELDEGSEVEAGQSSLLQEPQ